MPRREALAPGSRTTALAKGLVLARITINLSHPEEPDAAVLLALQLPFAALGTNRRVGYLESLSDFHRGEEFARGIRHGLSLAMQARIRPGWMLLPTLGSLISAPHVHLVHLLIHETKGVHLQLRDRSCGDDRPQSQDSTNRAPKGLHN